MFHKRCGLFDSVLQFFFGTEVRNLKRFKNRYGFYNFEEISSKEATLAG